MEDVQPSAIHRGKYHAHDMHGQRGRAGVYLNPAWSYRMHIRWTLGTLAVFAGVQFANTVASAECIQQNKGAHYIPATNAIPRASGS